MALRRDEQSGDHAWRNRAACRGEDARAFYAPVTFEPKVVRLAREQVAKSICQGCCVTDECLDHALRTREPHGVWGGLNEFERRALADRRQPERGVTYG